MIGAAVVGRVPGEAVAAGGGVAVVEGVEVAGGGVGAESGGLHLEPLEGVDLAALDDGEGRGREGVALEEEPPQTPHVPQVQRQAAQLVLAHVQHHQLQLAEHVWQRPALSLL